MGWVLYIETCLVRYVRTELIIEGCMKGTNHKGRPLLEYVRQNNDELKMELVRKKKIEDK